MSSTLKSGSVKSYVDTADALKANIASPTFTGTVTLPSGQNLTSPVINTGVSGTAIDTDTTLAANSDTKLASQKATKAYVDDLLHQGVEPGTAGIKNKNLSSWYTAMLNARTTPVDIVVFGDSISGSIFNHTGINDTQSWGAKLANLLNNRLGITGDASKFLYAKSDDTRTSMTATDGASPSSWLTYGIGGWAVELENNEYVRQESNMDGITIMYTKHANGGDLEIRDGGAGGTLLATIDTYAATTESGHTWTSGALTYASHNIYIKGVCGGGEKVVVEACYVHSGTRDKGFRVWQAAHGGMWTSILTANPAIGIHQVQRLQPSLIISACGTNDDSGNIDTRNRALIDALQAASPSSDITLWVPFIGSTYNETDRQILIEIANDYGLSYIDATVSIGAINQPGNLFAYDSIHPNHLGRTMIAYQAYQLLGGDPLSSALQEAIPKAPLANPIFTGTITGNLAGNVTGAIDLSNGANGSAKLTSVFGYPGFTLYNNASDANVAIGFINAPFASLIGYSSTAALVFGPGGASAIDVGISRTGASELTVYGSSSSTKSNVAIADPTADAHAATKSYVDTRNHQLVAKESGQYYSMAGLPSASALNGMTVAGAFSAMPVFLQAGTYDRIAVATTVAAVSTWRFGVYPSSPTTGLPDGQSLTLDCGTIDMNQTAGVLTATISLTIPTTGVYWLATLVDSYTATPTVVVWTSTSNTAQVPLLGVPTQMTAATATRQNVGRYATGVGTGSMPTTCPTLTWNSIALKVAVRAS